MTLSELERRGVRGQNFLDLHNYARSALPYRMTEFGMITQVGEKHGQPRPHPIVTSYLRAHNINYNQILHGGQTRCEVNLRCSVVLG